MKLLVTDYDNTYELHYDYTDNEKIFERNKKKLEEFMNNNIVCIATGRHFNGIKKTIDEKLLTFNYLCANNGAELYDSNYSLLYYVELDKHDIEVLKKLDEEVFFRCACNTNIICSANIYFDDINRYNKIKKILESKLLNSFVEYKFPKIKIINKKCNKIDIIEKIKEKEKIENKDIYTIGDDINDIDMIKYYNGSSLVTAKEEVKKISNKIFDDLSQYIIYLEKIKE